MVIALVVTTDGLPLAYEVFSGNTADKTTLPEFLAKIQRLYGKARRVWVMDRGIPTQATLAQMRADGVAYLVGTPKSLLPKLEQELLAQPWETVHTGMAVKLLEKEGELYVQARSDERQKKETAMRRRKLKALVRGLNRLKRRAGAAWKSGKRKQTLSRDQLLKRVAILRQQAGRVAGFVQVREPAPGAPVNRQTFGRPRPGPESAGGAGPTASDPDGGCLPADDRRPLADHAAVHRTRTRPAGPAGQAAPDPAPPTPAPHSQRFAGPAQRERR